MRHSKPHPQISTLSNFIYFFHAFNDFFALNDPKIEMAVQMNSKKFQNWHGIIISPT